MKTQFQSGSFKFIPMFPSAVLSTVLAGLNCLSADIAAGPVAPEPNVPPEEEVTSVAAKTVQVISKLRGVDQSAVTVRSSTNRIAGPFEVDIARTADPKKEAEQLSLELGPCAVVMLDLASANNGFRTNWAFLNGVGEQRSAPLVAGGVRPGEKRMVVLPKRQSSPSAPRNVRVAPPALR